MSISPGQPPPGSGVDLAAEKADEAGGADGPDAALGELPLRHVSHCVPVQRIRCMNDPEILERVLEGLVNLI
jgi:hypothetical protein